VPLVEHVLLQGPGICLIALGKSETHPLVRKATGEIYHWQHNGYISLWLFLSRLIQAWDLSYQLIYCVSLPLEQPLSSCRIQVPRKSRRGTGLLALVSPLGLLWIALTLNKLVANAELSHSRPDPSLPAFCRRRSKSVLSWTRSAAPPMVVRWITYTRECQTVGLQRRYIYHFPIILSPASSGCSAVVNLMTDANSYPLSGMTIL
jgi:hypothetical protein